jgi:hypothetical protein
MYLINFSHPLSAMALAEISEHFGDFESVVVPVNLDLAESFERQAQEVLLRTGFTPDQWATERIIINLPGMSPFAGVLLAQIHALSGHFPEIVRFLQDEDKSFHLAEPIDLQDVRNRARPSRF